MIECKVLPVTPDTARAMLVHNTNNRSIRQQHVAMLAKAMTDGTFYTNGAPIIFSDDGRLVDGQHRLLAVIKSGITVDFLIVKGVPVIDAKEYDTNVVRTQADQIAFRGSEPCFCSKSMIAASRFAINYLRCYNTSSKWTNYKPTTDEVLCFMHRNESAIRFVYAHIVSKLSKRNGLCIAQAPVIACFIAAHCSGYNLDDLSHFIDVLYTGESISPYELPIIRFRNHLASVSSSAYSIAIDKFLRAQYALKQYELRNSKGLCKPTSKLYYDFKEDQ